MKLTDYDTRRIINYLGGNTAQERKRHEIDRTTDVVLCGASETASEVFNRYKFRYSEARFMHLHKMYVDQAQRIVCQVDPEAMFCVYPGDLRYDMPVPVLTKSRIISESTKCILLPLNHKRHWGDINSVDKFDVPFSEKTDKLVWRGATTGNFLPENSPKEGYSSRAYVYSSPIKNKNIDVAFNSIVQFPEDWPLLPLLKAKTKPGLSMAEQLKCKYLLSLEGNDVASGLKWMLYSNSVVIMPAPVCESWACESFLVPYEHYVPVRYDLSNLNEVYEWCVSHPLECEEISRNGREFIKGFLDPEKESTIRHEVVSGYLSMADFEPAAHTLNPISNTQEEIRFRASDWLARGEAEISSRLLAIGSENFPDWKDEYGDPVFMKDILKLHLSLRQFDTAKSKILHIEGGSGWYNILFARALEKSGDTVEALSYWREFLKNHPHHSEAAAAVQRLTGC